MKLETTEQFEALMEGDSGKWQGDNALQGLLIMKDFLPEDATLIQGAGHDVIWGPNIEELINGGITEEAVRKLRELNWMIEDSTYLACFV